MDLGALLLPCLFLLVIPLKMFVIPFLPLEFLLSQAECKHHPLCKIIKWLWRILPWGDISFHQTPSTLYLSLSSSTATSAVTFIYAAALAFFPPCCLYFPPSPPSPAWILFAWCPPQFLTPCLAPQTCILMSPWSRCWTSFWFPLSGCTTPRGLLTSLHSGNSLLFCRLFISFSGTCWLRLHVRSHALRYSIKKVYANWWRLHIIISSCAHSLNQFVYF